MSSALIITIYVILVFSMFLLLNIFDLKYIKHLSDFKKLGLIFPVNLMFLIMILSFAGIPPLFGFSIKLVTFLLMIKGTVFFYTAFIAVFNFFTLYFYVQNVRYVINDSSNNYYVYINNFVYFSENVLFLLLLSMFLNLGGIFYLSDMCIFLSSIVI